MPTHGAWPCPPHRLPHPHRRSPPRFHSATHRSVSRRSGANRSSPAGRHWATSSILDRANQSRARGSPQSFIRRRSSQTPSRPHCSYWATNPFHNSKLPSLERNFPPPNPLTHRVRAMGRPVVAKQILVQAEKTDAVVRIAIGAGSQRDAGAPGTYPYRCSCWWEASPSSRRHGGERHRHFPMTSECRFAEGPERSGTHYPAPC